MEAGKEGYEILFSTAINPASFLKRPLKMFS